MTDPTPPPPVESPQTPVQYVYVQQQNRPTDPWSIISLVFGILSAAGGWCCFGFPGFIALITGGIGYIQTAEDENRNGRGMTIAGLILGALTGIPWLIFGLIGGLGAIFDSTK